MIAVDDVAVRNRGDHGCNRPDVVVLPGAEQAPAVQIVDLALVGRQARHFRERLRSGIDGVVIGHLGVVDEPSSQDALARAGRQMLPIRSFDALDGLRQCQRHILQEVSAVRARIADELVSFIQRLCDIQRFLRAEAVQAVGVPLEFC